MQKIILFIILTTALIVSCDDNIYVSLTLPDKNEIDRVLVFSVDENDPYHGIFDVTTKKKFLKSTIVERSKIDQIYNAISENYSGWAQSSKVPKGINVAVEFYNKNDRVMMLWLSDDEAHVILMKKPVDPKNFSVIYVPEDKKVILMLKKYLGLK